MGVIDAAAVLVELDRLPYPARQRRLAEIARQAPPEELLELLAALNATGGYLARQSALTMATVARSHEGVAAALDAPEASICMSALVSAVRIGAPIAELVRRYPSLPADHRKCLLRAVRRHRASQLAEALLPLVIMADGESAAAALLSACGQEFATEHLPDLAHAVGFHWKQLGRRFPDLLIDFARSWRERTAPSERDRLWATVASGLAEASLVRPERVLELAETFGADASLTGSEWSGRLGLLARNSPELTVRLLTDHALSAAVGGRSFWEAVGLLPLSTLLPLIQAAAGRPGQLRLIFLALRPVDRTDVWDAVLADREPHVGLLPVLDTLPRAERVARAEAMLLRPQVQQDTRFMLQIQARLEADQAHAHMLTAARDNDPSLRVAAWTLLATIARLQNGAAPSQHALALSRTQREREPVRTAALRAASALPVHSLNDRAISGIVDAALAGLDRPDSSMLEGRAASLLAMRLLEDGLRHDRAPARDGALRLIVRLAEAERLTLTGPFAEGAAALGGLPGAKDVLADVIAQTDWSPTGSPTETRQAAEARMASRAVGTAAIGALAQGEDMIDDLPLLLTQADEHRIQLVLPGLSRLARRLPPARVTEALSPLLTQPSVGSRKAGVLFLSENAAEAGIEQLVEVWSRPGQHRDVSRAVVREMTGRLDDDRAWSVLDACTADPEQRERCADVITRKRPGELPERHRDRYAGLIHALAETGTDNAAQLGISSLASWGRHDPQAAALLAVRVVNLDDVATWRWAANALVTVTLARAESFTGFNAEPPEVLRDTIRTLRDVREEPSLGRPQRDLPARQRLTHLVALVVSPRRHSRTSADIAQLVAAELQPHGSWVHLAVDLAVTRVRFDALDQPTVDLRAVASLANEPWLAQRAAVRLGNHLGALGVPAVSAALLSAAAALAGGTLAEAMFSLALVRRTGPALADNGWPEVLSQLRRSPHSVVRVGALETFVYRE